MYKVVLYTVLLIIFQINQSGAAVYSVTVDADAIPGIAQVDEGSETFIVTLGGAGEIITDVDIEIEFGKSDDTCVSFDSDDSDGYNNEIAYKLSSPTGTEVALIDNDNGNAGSGNGATYGDNGTNTELGTTVNLSDEESDIVGSTNSGNPESGSFQPIESLDAFDNEDPSGDWMLTAYDDSSGDPLCHQGFSLTVFTDNDFYIVTNIPEQSSDAIDESDYMYTATIPANGIEEIIDVDIELTFGKSDNTCISFGDDDGDGYNNEIAYRLVSPSATSVALIENDSDNAGSGIGSSSYADNSTNTPLDTVVMLDDDANDVVGSTNLGTPEPGTFHPIGTLANFNGESPFGDWAIYGYDDSAGDPLCHQSATLIVTTQLPDIIFKNGFEPLPD